MTPQDLAQLHARAFAPERGWQAQEFQVLLDNPQSHLFIRPHGFALVRTILGEAELLTLAVDPDHHRKGIADGLMRDWITALPGQTAFLEVAADNKAARALYEKHGFAQIALRKGYYARPDGPAINAVIMQATLTHGKSPESKPRTPKTG